MIVRFFLAFAVALHRIATTLRIVAAEAETAQHHKAARTASANIDIADDAVIAARQLAAALRHDYNEISAKRWVVALRNSHSVNILKSSVL